MAKLFPMNILSVFLVLISLGGALAGTSMRGTERRNSEIFSVTSQMKWNIFAPNPYIFSTTQMYFMQKTASSFFEKIIKESILFDDQNVILVSYKLRDQFVDNGSVQTTLTGEIEMTYSGNVISDFSTLLYMVVGNDEIELLIRTFIQDGFLGQTSTSSSVKYNSNGDSYIIAKDNVDKYIIIFVVLISISGFLALTTFTILITSKCRNGSHRRYSHEQELKRTQTSETEEPISPTGILGADIQKANGDVIITPQRNIVNSYNETPMSMDSNMSDAKSTLSTSSSTAPLGIMSMNNLRKLMFSEEKKKSTVALYNVGLDDKYEDEEDEGL